MFESYLKIYPSPTISNASLATHCKVECENARGSDSVLFLFICLLAFLHRLNNSDPENTLMKISLIDRGDVKSKARRKCNSTIVNDGVQQVLRLD